MRKLAPRVTDATRADALRRMQAHRASLALSSLGQQLAVAAGLTRAFNEGAEQYRHFLLGAEPWRPGCGRQAP